MNLIDFIRTLGQVRLGKPNLSDEAIIGLSTPDTTAFRFRNDKYTGAMEAWYLAGNVIGASGFGGLGFASDILYCIPFVSPIGGTLDSISFSVQTGGVLGDVAVVGIYDSIGPTDPYPNNLLAQGTEQDTSTTGVKVDTISVTLEPGKLYWCVFFCNNVSTTTQVLSINGQYVMGLGAAAPSLGAPYIQLINTSLAYTNVLPAVFPDATNSQLDSNPIPAIGVRYSS